MTTVRTPVPDAYVSLKEQATYRVFADLITIACMTGNPAGAQSRYQQAKEVLSDASLKDLAEMAKEDHGVTLD